MSKPKCNRKNITILEEQDEWIKNKKKEDKTFKFSRFVQDKLTEFIEAEDSNQEKEKS